MEDDTVGTGIVTEQAEILRVSELLADISEALERVSGGMYGKCKLCGSYIQGEVLIADPLADLCGLCNVPVTDSGVGAGMTAFSGDADHQYSDISGELI